MAQLDVLVPRINNNDDVVRLVEWHVAAGARVDAGAALATLETAKAAVEVPCESAGFVRWLPSTPELRVGGVLAVVTTTAEEPFSAPHSAPSAPARATSCVVHAEPRAAGDVRLSLKARAVARALGVAEHDVASAARELAPHGGVVGEAEVRAFAARRASGIENGVIDAPARTPRPSARTAVIVGDGAHARYVHDTVVRAHAARIAGCVSNERARGELVGVMPVLGRDEDLAALLRDGVRTAFVGVGSARSGSRSNDARRRIYERLVELGFDVPVVVDPDASVSATATLGPGTLVGARAVLSAHAATGVNCLVNVGAIVCHDVRLGDHVHVTPGAILAGSVSIGDGSTIGMAATVLDGTRVGRNCLVPNNARVLRDLADGEIAPLA